jgi:Putative prokaryotic signal transducing protein
MKEKNKLIRVYSGTEVSVILLKGRLEEIGISAIIQNDYKSGIDAGFVGGVQSAIDLYIQQFDYKKAESIISEFIKNKG